MIDFMADYSCKVEVNIEGIINDEYTPVGYIIVENVAL